MLPSKIFEYIAVGKPIVAGLNGYSARFIKKNIGHAYLFNPGDIDECILCIQKASTLVVNHNDIDRFIIYSQYKSARYTVHFRYNIE